VPPAVAADVPYLLSHSDWTFHPSIMLANALTAFILNLVRACVCVCVCVCADIVLAVGFKRMLAWACACADVAGCAVGVNDRAV